MYPAASRIIVGDAEFEPGTSASKVYSALPLISQDCDTELPDLEWDIREWEDGSHRDEPTHRPAYQSPDSEEWDETQLNRAAAQQGRRFDMTMECHAGEAVKDHRVSTDRAAQGAEFD